MKRVKDCKDVSIMSPQDEQWSTDKFTLFVYCNFLDFIKYNRMQSKRKQTKYEHSRRKSYVTAFSEGITKLNQKII